MKPVLSAFSSLLVAALWLRLECPVVAAQPSPVFPQESHAAPQQTSPQAEPARLNIPGPLRPFLRLAAISQKAPPEEVLSLLARNVTLLGYRFIKDKGLRPTEYMILLKGYLEQAGELRTLAGPGAEIRISGCTGAASLLTTLGYRLRQPCGPNITLETADPKRAFLTIDSGFPLVELEEALRKDRPFSYTFADSKLPVLFSPSDWSANGKAALSSLLDQPALARLYWAMSRLDENTRATLRRSPGFQRLLPLAPLIDFYGGNIRIRSGRALVPGGTAAEAAWAHLVGAKPNAPAEFITRLLEKDIGWLAAYFDTLARIPRPQQAYFTEPRRLARFYEVLRAGVGQRSPVSAIFRPPPGLLLLTSRLHLDAGGQPHIPGNLEIWRDFLRGKGSSKQTQDLVRRSKTWNRPEQLIEVMFSLSQLPREDTALQVFLTLSEIDRRRPPARHLSPQTVRLLIEKYVRLGSQYLLFSEWSALDDESITSFVRATESLDSIADPQVRMNAIGIFQANIGLWQILARQEQIAAGRLNESWRQVINPLIRIKSSEQLFNAARTSLTELYRTVTGNSSFSHEEFLALLAGPEQSTAAGQQIRQELANRMRAVIAAQRLVSPDSLFELADGLSQMDEGKAVSSELLIRRAGELHEIEVPKPIFSNQEKRGWVAGNNINPHIAAQTRTDWSKIFSRPGHSSRELAEARGRLTPYLRDTLVGLNYAYYEPPGAQMLHNNALFVPSHDFSENFPDLGEGAWRKPHLSSRDEIAGLGIHLKGSLIDLPRALAQVEQDFLVPEDIQALVWSDLVPDLLTGAVLPRWWRVTPNELHAVALYQRLGEELVTAAAENATLGQIVFDILSDQLDPRSLNQIEGFLRAGRAQEALVHLAPAQIFHLAVEYRAHHPEEAGSRWAAGRELEGLARQYPEEVNPDRIARDFGAPHPFLARTYARELLALQFFPTFLRYSSRLLAESWESNNLYWGRLADEKGYAPVALHKLVPVLTHRMVEKIVATHLDDWPAILRALRETGEEFRGGRIAQMAKEAEPVSHP